MTLVTYHALVIAVVVFGMLVMTSSSPISAVIYLVLTYLAGGGLFLLMGHSFLGLALIVVYVGAITIIFLFTIFMINQADSPSRETSRVVFPLVAVGVGISQWTDPSTSSYAYTTDWSHTMVTAGTQEIDTLAQVIFTAQPLCLFLVAYLLLVVMVGVIKGNKEV